VNLFFILLVALILIENSSFFSSFLFYNEFPEGLSCFLRHLGVICSKIEKIRERKELSACYIPQLELLFIQLFLDFLS